MERLALRWGGRLLVIAAALVAAAASRASGPAKLTQITFDRAEGRTTLEASQTECPSETYTNPRAFPSTASLARAHVIAELASHPYEEDKDMDGNVLRRRSDWDCETTLKFEYDLAVTATISAVAGVRLYSSDPSSTVVKVLVPGNGTPVVLLLASQAKAESLTRVLLAADADAGNLTTAASGTALTLSYDLD